MADPIVEQIAQNLATSVAAVTVANGYNYSVKEVVRPTREGGYKPGHLVCVITQGDATVRDGASNFKTWDQPFYVSAFVVPEDGSGDIVDTILNRFRADIEKQIMTDRTLGGLANPLTDIGDPTNLVSSDKSFEGVEIRVDVVYRHDIGDPYSQTGGP